MKNPFLTAGAAILLLGALTARAEIKVTVEHHENSEASGSFKFKNVPSPSKSDAAAKAKFTIVDGEQDDNGGSVEKLNDGGLPTEEDQPAENFFFNAGTEGGRLKASFEEPVAVTQINTYSWHPNTRGPQVYKVYGSDGKAENFDAAPKHGTDPEKCGWKLIATVDTRPKSGDAGGQYGVSISSTDGTIGTYRHILFDIKRTESDDSDGNTFYSEIDIVK